MHIKYPDGTEVFTSDEAPTVPERKKRLGERYEQERRAGRRLFAKSEGLTTRQRTESAVKRIVKGMWDYASGDGDDFDRALRMAGTFEDEDPPATVLPDDD